MKRRKLRQSKKGTDNPPVIHIDLLDTKENVVLPEYWIKELALYRSDRNSLNDGEWLTDAVINASQSLLKSQFKIGGLQSTNHGHTLTYDVVHEEFVQVLNIRGNHWVTISNVNCPPNHINVFDSMLYGDLPTRSKQQIAAIMFTESKDITLNFMDVQSQRGASDCGLFSRAFATSICFGFDPVHIQYTQADLRNHLIRCLANGAMSTFPHTQRKRYSVRKISVVKYGLYCTCRQPESGQMVQCNVCHEWYHDECVTIPNKVWMDKKLKWICKQCTCH